MKILLVEDDEAVRTLLARVLRREGYTVTEAADGAEALTLLVELPHVEIHLLLTDIVMPHVGGPELAQRLRATGQVQRVIFMSGYVDAALSLNQGLTMLLRKPFVPTTLTSMVREILAQS